MIAKSSRSYGIIRASQHCVIGALLALTATIPCYGGNSMADSQTISDRKTRQQVLDELECDGACSFHMLPGDRIADILGVTRKASLSLPIHRGWKNMVRCSRFMSYLDQLPNEQWPMAAVQLPPMPTKEEDYRWVDPRQQYVYLISWQGLYKIGCSVEPKQRLTGLNQARFPFIRPAVLLHKVKTKNMVFAEKYLHTRFDSYRIERPWREWFNLPKDSVKWICALKDGDLDE